MIRAVFLLLGLTALAACGADGEPVTPTMNAGVSVSSSGGVGTWAGIGVRKGPLSILFGL